MTKARDVVRRISRAARDRNLEFGLAREGGRHTVYDLDGLAVVIPRHSEIGEGLTQAIYKQCEPKLGKGWWRR